MFNKNLSFALSFNLILLTKALNIVCFFTKLFKMTKLLFLQLEKKKLIRENREKLKRNNPFHFFFLLKEGIKKKLSKKFKTPIKFSNLYIFI